MIMRHAIQEMKLLDGRPRNGERRGEYCLSETNRRGRWCRKCRYRTYQTVTPRQLNRRRERPVVELNSETLTKVWDCRVDDNIKSLGMWVCHDRKAAFARRCVPEQLAGRMAVERAVGSPQCAPHGSRRQCRQENKLSDGLFRGAHI